MYRYEARTGASYEASYRVLVYEARRQLPVSVQESSGEPWDLDQLLKLEQPPSNLHFEAWIHKIDIHLIAMEHANQKASDAQIVGRVLSQLQRFTTDRWCSRAENIQSTMISDEQKTWDSSSPSYLNFPGKTLVSKE
ncbi:hypothetical protein T484DRAFT_1757779 [Baffinella frigidus]|nr:hypothetical protein T484DRAFT_1757779 [Cryptophyta sp. CCMP2293]